MPRQHARQITMDLFADPAEPTPKARPPRAQAAAVCKAVAPAPMKPTRSVKSIGATVSNKTKRAVSSTWAPGRATPAPEAAAKTPARPAIKKPAAGVAVPAPPKKRPAAPVSTSQKQKTAATPSRLPAKVHRIVDLSQPHNTNTQDGALLFALHILSGAHATWEHLKHVGPSDDELARAVETYFPSCLGFHAERQKGFYIGRRPEPFFVWGNAATAGRYLAGPALLKRVRAVLCLPDRTEEK